MGGKHCVLSTVLLKKWWWWWWWWTVSTSQLSTVSTISYRPTIKSSDFIDLYSYYWD